MWLHVDYKEFYQLIPLTYTPIQDLDGISRQRCNKDITYISVG